jgi:transposase InsO family protein
VKLTKTLLAKVFKLSKSRLYYKSKIKKRDADFLVEIKNVMDKNPSYGSPRISIALQANHKRVERVMKANGIKALRRRRSKPFKPDDINQEPAKYKNLIKNLCVIRPRIIYATDFTYIHYQGSVIYLATVIDVFTREILGYEISTRHTATMMQRVLAIAFQYGIPEYLHSDQGSEMKSELYTSFAEGQGVKISMSSKACPWQNGFQESYYNGFKLDLGEVEQFETRAELIEAIYRNINYYNNERIHTSLRMAPRSFFNKYQASNKLLKQG